MEVLSKSTKDTKELAGSIASKLKSKDVLALYGDLGSAKTTFTSYLVDALGISSRVQSPTFVIARKYTSPKMSVNHVDLYRLTESEDFEDIGLEEMFEEEDAITIIEWPEIAEDVLPKRTIKIHFEYVSEDGRKINVQNLN